MSSIDFNSATFDELDELAMQQLVFDASELSPILKGHLFIERIVETIISNHLKDPKALFQKNRLTFDLKIDLASAMGILDKKYISAFKALNKIRNNYAHKDDYKVTYEELSSLKLDWIEPQDRAFRTAKAKGVEEAAKIATIFLCWKALLLIKKPGA